MTVSTGIRTVAVAAALLGTAPAAARGQGGPDCTYDACAVRLQTRFLSGVRVVQGANAERVSRNGFFAMRVAVFDSAGDSVRTPYQSYRRYSRRAGLIGIVSGVAGALAYVSYDDGDDDMGHVFLGTGLVLGVVSAYHVAKGHDALQRAIWAYNRRFAR